MKVVLTSYTPEPELAIALAARRCIRDQDHEEICTDLPKDEIRRLIATVIGKGHHSVLEHVSFTFDISGVSRVLSHQLVRHRIASYSQLSQQRVDSSSLAYVMPPEVRRDPALLDQYENAMEVCRSLYSALIERGVPLGSGRYVLPSAFTTRIMTTMNARSLFNLIEQRACAAEEWEFRPVATLIHKRLLNVAPDIFRFAGTTCVTNGFCLEGETGLNCRKREVTNADIRNTREAIAKAVAG